MPAILPIERVQSDASVVSLVEEVWTYAERNVRSLVRTKPSRQVLIEFLGLARGDALAAAAEDDDALDFSVRNPGGRCSMSKTATEHWMALSVLSMRPAIDAVLATLGFRFDEKTPALAAVLEKSPHTPLVELGGVLYCVEVDAGGALSLWSDDGLGVRDPAALPRAQRTRAETVALSRCCECALCKVLRAGKRKVLDVAALRRQQASVRETNNLRRALAEPTHVHTLNLYERGLEALPAEIGRMTRLAQLRAWDNALRSLPDSIGDCTSLRELALSNNPLERLPEAIGRCPLEELGLHSTALRALPLSLARCPLRKLELGFRLNPAPASFLEPLRFAPGVKVWT